MKKITILGSTGSIGRSALEIISSNKDEFRVVGLTAGKNISLLEKQIRTFKPEVVAVADKAGARELQKKLRKILSAPEIFAGEEGVASVAAYEGSDFVLSAIVGSAGLIPTLAAIRAGKTIGLANKESLVMAGRIIFREAKKNRVKILPVDSEHSAIFQCMQGRGKAAVKRIILTASGGPFAGKNKKSLDKITPADALRHPNWSMGKKITIDSATLMNKGLEVIEARHLFNLSSGKIDVLIHPQSIVHSMVEFNDCSILAQLSVPDMKGPIAYAMTYPRRLHNVLHDLSLHEIGTLTFQRPDTKRFPCLSYAYIALEAGGTMPSVLNAANEIAVHAFLRGSIKFSQIPVIIKKTMDSHSVMPDTDLDVIIDSDRWARKKAEEFIRG
jgi:1-deoxy-D-xylulose-5-phosphate reductoisomerase